MRSAEGRPAYDAVPAVDPQAQPDTHWAELSGGSGLLLPGAYMPPPMRGRQPLWRRAAAVTVIAMLVSATAGGICLTYGPEELLRLLS